MDIKKYSPYKSVAAALLFSAILGPVGLLYSTVQGGIIMILLAFITISAKVFHTLALVWIGSCVWGVAATNKYNLSVMQILADRK